MIDILDKQQEGGDQDAPGKKLTEAEIEEVESFWRDKLEVLKNADQFDSKDNGQGSTPGGMGIEIESILEKIELSISQLKSM